MRVDFPSGNEALALAQAHVLPPRHELLGILEAAGTHVQPVEHGRSVAIASRVALARSRRCRCVRAAGRRRLAEDVFAVVGWVPGAEANVTEDDFVDVALDSGGAGFSEGFGGLLRGRGGGCWFSRRGFGGLVFWRFGSCR